MSFDTPTYSHKTWDHTYISHPTLSLLLSWPRSSIMDSAWLERSILSCLLCADNFTPQIKRLFSKNLGVTGLQWFFHSMLHQRENVPVKNVIKIWVPRHVPCLCKKRLCYLMRACVRVCYLSVGRSTRWWRWGRRWRWKPAVPERHLSLRMVLRCESPPLHRDLRKNKRDN